MKESLRPGVSRVSRIEVDRDRTIGFMGEEGRVYGTPYLVRDIEQTCRQLITRSRRCRRRLGRYRHRNQASCPDIARHVGRDHGHRDRGGRSQGRIRDIGQGRHRTDQHRNARPFRGRRQQDHRTLESESSQARRRRIGMINMPAKPAHNERTVSTYCYQCVAGPDLLKVRVEDGIATEVTPNFDAATIHPAGGKACVKAFGLVQKAYNPESDSLSDEADESRRRVVTKIRALFASPGKRRYRSSPTSSMQCARPASPTKQDIRASPRASAAAARRPPTWERCPRSWRRGARST